MKILLTESQINGLVKDLVKNNEGDNYYSPDLNILSVNDFVYPESHPYAGIKSTRYIVGDEKPLGEFRIGHMMYVAPGFDLYDETPRNWHRCISMLGEVLKDFVNNRYKPRTIVFSPQGEMQRKRYQSNELIDFIMGYISNMYSSQIDGTNTVFSLKRINEQYINEDSLKDMVNNNPIYHYTTLQSARKIIDSDTLLGGGDNTFKDEKLKNSKHGKYISFTRDRNLDLTKQNFGIGGGTIDPDLDDTELVVDVIFVINRDKLKTRYKLEPFSFDSMVGHYEYNDTEDYGDDEEDFDRVGYTEKDKEKEERVLIDKITPLRPYIMDIIYNGPDKNLKKRIKEYLGEPSYVGKPRVDFEKYNNWVSPSGDELKNIYVGDAREYFKSFKEFVTQYNESRVVRIDKFGDQYIDGRTQTNTQRKLFNKFPDKKQEILSLFDKFNNKQKITAPIVVVFESGERVVVSGNIVMDVAFQLGIEPKVIIVKSNMEEE